DHGTGGHQGSIAARSHWRRTFTKFVVVSLVAPLVQRCASKCRCRRGVATGTHRALVSGNESSLHAPGHRSKACSGVKAASDSTAESEGALTDDKRAAMQRLPDVTQ